MRALARFVLLMALGLATAIFAGPEKMRLDMVDRMYDVGYFNKSEYADRVEKIDPKRKFFIHVGAGGSRLRSGISAKFVSVAKKD